MWGSGYPAAHGTITLAFLCAMVVAVVVVAVVVVTGVPALERRLRSDLIPWVVLGSFLAVLLGGVLLFPHLIHDTMIRK